YQSLCGYLDNIKLSQQINTHALVIEEKKVVDAISSALASSDDERNLLFVMDYFQVMVKFILNQVSRLELDYYNSQAKEFSKRFNSLILSRQNEITAIDNIFVVMKPYMEEMVDFYNLAVRRDTEFVNNFVISRKNQRKDIVMVLGGFHAQGVSRILKDKNISYVTVAPRVAVHTQDDINTYYDLLRGERPLDIDEILGITLALPDYWGQDWFMERLVVKTMKMLVDEYEAKGQKPQKIEKNFKGFFTKWVADFEAEKSHKFSFDVDQVTNQKGEVVFLLDLNGKKLNIAMKDGAFRAVGDVEAQTVTDRANWAESVKRYAQAQGKQVEQYLGNMEVMAAVTGRKSASIIADVNGTVVQDLDEEAVRKELQEISPSLDITAAGENGYVVYNRELIYKIVRQANKLLGDDRLSVQSFSPSVEQDEFRKNFKEFFEKEDWRQDILLGRSPRNVIARRRSGEGFSSIAFSMSADAKQNVRTEVARSDAAAAFGSWLAENPQTAGEMADLQQRYSNKLLDSVVKEEKDSLMLRLRFEPVQAVKEIVQNVAGFFEKYKYPITIGAVAAGALATSILASPALASGVVMLGALSLFFLWQNDQKKEGVITGTTSAEEEVEKQIEEDKKAIEEREALEIAGFGDKLASEPVQQAIGDMIQTNFTTGKAAGFGMLDDGRMNEMETGVADRVFSVRGKAAAGSLHISAVNKNANFYMPAADDVAAQRKLGGMSVKIWGTPGTGYYATVVDSSKIPEKEYKKIYEKSLASTKLKNLEDSKAVHFYRLTDLTPEAAITRNFVSGRKKYGFEKIEKKDMEEAVKNFESKEAEIVSEYAVMATGQEPRAYREYSQNSWEDTEDAIETARLGIAAFEENRDLGESQLFLEYRLRGIEKARNEKEDFRIYTEYKEKDISEIRQKLAETETALASASDNTERKLYGDRVKGLEKLLANNLARINELTKEAEDLVKRTGFDDLNSAYEKLKNFSAESLRGNERRLKDALDEIAVLVSGADFDTAKDFTGFTLDQWVAANSQDVYRNDDFNKLESLIGVLLANGKIDKAYEQFLNWTGTESDDVKALRSRVRGAYNERFQARIDELADRINSKLTEFGYTDKIGALGELRGYDDERLMQEDSEVQILRQELDTLMNMLENAPSHVIDGLTGLGFDFWLSEKTGQRTYRNEKEYLKVIDTLLAHNMPDQAIAESEKWDGDRDIYRRAKNRIGESVTLVAEREPAVSEEKESGLLPIQVYQEIGDNFMESGREEFTVNELEAAIELVKSGKTPVEAVNRINEINNELKERFFGQFKEKAFRDPTETELEDLLTAAWDQADPEEVQRSAGETGETLEIVRFVQPGTSDETAEETSEEPAGTRGFSQDEMTMAEVDEESTVIIDIFKEKIDESRSGLSQRDELDLVLGDLNEEVERTLESGADELVIHNKLQVLTAAKTKVMRRLDEIEEETALAMAGDEESESYDESEERTIEEKEVPEETAPVILDQFGRPVGETEEDVEEKEVDIVVESVPGPLLKDSDKTAAAPVKKKLTRAEKKARKKAAKQEKKLLEVEKRLAGSLEKLNDRIGYVMSDADLTFALNTIDSMKERIKSVEPGQHSNHVEGMSASLEDYKSKIDENLDLLTRLHGEKKVGIEKFAKVPEEPAAEEVEEEEQEEAVIKAPSRLAGAYNKVKDVFKNAVAGLRGAPAKVSDGVRKARERSSEKSKLKAEIKATAKQRAEFNEEQKAKMKGFSDADYARLADGLLDHYKTSAGEVYKSVYADGEPDEATSLNYILKYINADIALIDGGSIEPTQNFSEYFGEKYIDSELDKLFILKVAGDIAVRRLKEIDAGVPLADSEVKKQIAEIDNVIKDDKVIEELALRLESAGGKEKLKSVSVMISNLRPAVTRLINNPKKIKFQEKKELIQGLMDLWYYMDSRRSRDFSSAAYIFFTGLLDNVGSMKADSKKQAVYDTLKNFIVFLEKKNYNDWAGLFNKAFNAESRNDLHFLGQKKEDMTEQEPLSRDSIKDADIVVLGEKHSLLSTKAYIKDVMDKLGVDMLLVERIGLRDDQIDTRGIKEEDNVRFVYRKRGDVGLDELLEEVADSSNAKFGSIDVSSVLFYKMLKNADTEQAQALPDRNGMIYMDEFISSDIAKNKKAAGKFEGSRSRFWARMIEVIKNDNPNAKIAVLCGSGHQQSSPQDGQLSLSDMLKNRMEGVKVADIRLEATAVYNKPVAEHTGDMSETVYVPVEYMGRLQPNMLNIISSGKQVSKKRTTALNRIQDALRTPERKPSRGEIAAGLEMTKSGQTPRQIANKINSVNAGLKEKLSASFENETGYKPDQQQLNGMLDETWKLVLSSRTGIANFEQIVSRLSIENITGNYIRATAPTEAETELLGKIEKAVPSNLPGRNRIVDDISNYMNENEVTDMTSMQGLQKAIKGVGPKTVQNLAKEFNIPAEEKPAASPDPIEVEPLSETDEKSEEAQVKLKKNEDVKNWIRWGSEKIIKGDVNKAFEQYKYAATADDPEIVADLVQKLGELNRKITDSITGIEKDLRQRQPGLPNVDLNNTLNRKILQIIQTERNKTRWITQYIKSKDPKFHTFFGDIEDHVKYMGAEIAYKQNLEDLRGEVFKLARQDARYKDRTVEHYSTGSPMDYDEYLAIRSDIETLMQYDETVEKRNNLVDLGKNVGIFQGEQSKKLQTLQATATRSVSAPDEQDGFLSMSTKGIRKGSDAEKTAKEKIKDALRNEEMTVYESGSRKPVGVGEYFVKHQNPDEILKGGFAEKVQKELFGVDVPAGDLLMIADEEDSDIKDKIKDKVSKYELDLRDPDTKELNISDVLYVQEKIPGNYVSGAENKYKKLGIKLNLTDDMLKQLARMGASDIVLNNTDFIHNGRMQNIMISPDGENILKVDTDKIYEADLMDIYKNVYGSSDYKEYIVTRLNTLLKKADLIDSDFTPKQREVIEKEIDTLFDHFTGTDDNKIDSLVSGISGEYADMDVAGNKISHHMGELASKLKESKERIKNMVAAETERKTETAATVSFADSQLNENLDFLKMNGVLESMGFLFYEPWMGFKLLGSVGERIAGRRKRENAYKEAMGILVEELKIDPKILNYDFVSQVREEVSNKLNNEYKDYEEIRRSVYEVLESKGVKIKFVSIRESGTESLDDKRKNLIDTIINIFIPDEVPVYRGTEFVYAGKTGDYEISRSDWAAGDEEGMRIATKYAVEYNPENPVVIKSTYGDLREAGIVVSVTNLIHPTVIYKAADIVVKHTVEVEEKPAASPDLIEVKPLSEELDRIIDEFKTSFKNVENDEQAEALVLSLEKTLLAGEKAGKFDGFSIAKAILGMIGFLSDYNYVVNTNSRWTEGDKHLVLFNIEDTLIRETDEGPVEVDILNQITATADGKAQAPVAEIGIDRVYVVKDYIEELFESAKFILYEEATPDPSLSANLYRLQTIYFGLLKKAYSGRSEDEVKDAIMEIAIAHEVEHKRRHRKLGAKTDNMDKEEIAQILDKSILDEQLSEFKSIIDTGYIDEELAGMVNIVAPQDYDETVYLDNAPIAWAVLGRITGENPENQDRILTKLQKLVPKSTNHKMKLARKAYNDVEKEWEEAFRDRLTLVAKAGQMGKPESVRYAGIDKENNSITINDVEEGEKHERPVMPQGQIDENFIKDFTERLQQSINSLSANDPRKAAMNAMLDIIRNLPADGTPDYFGIEGALVKDFFGTGSPSNQDNIIALYSPLTDQENELNTVALSHELGEYRSTGKEPSVTYSYESGSLNGIRQFLEDRGYFKKDGMLGNIARAIGNRASGTLIIKDNVNNKTSTVKLSGDALSIALKGVDPENPQNIDNHYGLRALARQAFGGQDRQLTDFIKSEPLRNQVLDEHKEIVKIDFAQGNFDEAVEAIKDGKAVELDLKGLLGQGDTGFDITADRLNGLAQVLGKAFDVPYEGKASYDKVEKIVLEIVKNAFLHGNKLNFNLPIFIAGSLDAAGKMVSLEVYDTASAAGYTTYGGFGRSGMAKQQIEDYWSYDKSDSIDTFSRKTGTKVTVSRKTGEPSEGLAAASSEELAETPETARKNNIELLINEMEKESAEIFGSNYRMPALSKEAILSAYLNNDLKIDKNNVASRPLKDNPVDMDLAEKWIEGHSTDELKTLARFLVDHIKHIDQMEFETAVEETVQEYKDSPYGDKPYFIVMYDEPSREKSDNWVYKLALEKGLHPAREIVTRFDGERIAQLLDQGLEALIIDDASYSGKTVVQTITNISGALKNRGLSSDKLHVMVPFMTNRAVSSIERIGIPYKNISVDIVDKYRIMPTISEIFEKESETDSSIKDLYQLLEKETFHMGADADYGAVTLTYFQHKTADGYSLMRPLTTGELIGDNKGVNPRVRFIPATFEPYKKDSAKRHLLNEYGLNSELTADLTISNQIVDEIIREYGTFEELKSRLDEILNAIETAEKSRGSITSKEHKDILVDYLKDPSADIRSDQRLAVSVAELAVVPKADKLLPDIESGAVSQGKPGSLFDRIAGAVNKLISRVPGVTDSTRGEISIDLSGEPDLVITEEDLADEPEIVITDEDLAAEEGAGVTDRELAGEPDMVITAEDLYQGPDIKMSDDFIENADKGIRAERIAPVRPLKITSAALERLLDIINRGEKDGKEHKALLFGEGDLIETVIIDEKATSRSASVESLIDFDLQKIREMNAGGKQFLAYFHNHPVIESNINTYKEFGIDPMRYYVYPSYGDMDVDIQRSYIVRDSVPEGQVDFVSIIGSRIDGEYTMSMFDIKKLPPKEDIPRVGEGDASTDDPRLFEELGILKEYPITVAPESEVAKVPSKDLTPIQRVA
ncbi:hypothetical protein ACFLTD_00660, partial [Elusimicrobiota bacterium]